MLYILWGEDDYSLNQYLGVIKKGLGDSSLLEMNTTSLEGQKLALDQLKAVCETIPFMAEKRLVIIKGLLERFEPKSGRQKKNGAETREEEYKPFVDCISRLPETTVLVLVAPIVLKSSNPLLKELLSVAQVKSFPLIKGDRLQGWIIKYMTKKEGSISPEAVNLLAELVGSNLWVLGNEIDKLLLFTSGRRIEAEDVRSVVSYAQETSVFTMIDAIIEFKAGLAEELLQQLLQRGAAPSFLLVLLTRQVRMMVRINELKNRGTPEKEMQSALGISNEYAWRRTLERAGKYSLERLVDIYHWLLEADLAIKTRKYDGELALNLLIADLCAARK